MFQADTPHSTGPTRPHASPPAPASVAAFLASLAAAMPTDGAANVLAFPPQPRDAALIVALIEHAPKAELLPLAGRAMALASLAPPSRAGAAHALFATMLLCARLLDAAAYPWEAASPARAPHAIAPAGDAA